MIVPHLEEQDFRHTRHQGRLPPPSTTQSDCSFLGKPISLPFGVWFPRGEAQLGSRGWGTPPWLPPQPHRVAFSRGRAAAAELPPTLPRTTSPFIQPRAGRHPAPVPDTHGGECIRIETRKGSTAGKEEEEEEEQGTGRESGWGFFCKGDFSAAHTQQMFPPKGSSFLFLTWFLQRASGHQQLSSCP